MGTETHKKARPLRAWATDARARELPEGQLAVPLFARGTMSLECYAPLGTDTQHPHDQDGFYILISGNGDFVCGDERTPFGPSDVLFAPAGMRHRFEEFSDGFDTWVVFDGPNGGEKSP
jgi:mannose-6-phosphate isomerase-like protein (cupin superfamily)